MPLWLHAWRRWGWLAVWAVPAVLTLEVVGLAGCYLAPRGSLVEAAALVVVLVPVAVAGLLVAAAGVAGLVVLLAGPWRWAREKTFGWTAR
jgi:succinate-acetate transporter protein